MTLALFECSSKPLSIRDEEPLENVIPANKGFTTQARTSLDMDGTLLLRSQIRLVSTFERS